MALTRSPKSFEISEWLVLEAYRRVKQKGGSAGVDDQSLSDFEQNLQNNLYKLWNRLSSGSYFPPPVKQVEIPKKQGGSRKLGIPTVTDRIAQMVVKMSIEPTLEPIFHADSYGYRPGKSAHEAVSVTRERCWRYPWVVEFDIQGAFDHIDHELLMKAVEHHVKEPWQLLYIQRWLVAPFETVDGEQIDRTAGVPQGGVVSPLLMNLFMHYAFDHWMEKQNPGCPFARYADDGVVHCRTRSEAEQLLQTIAGRFEACKLTLHPKKSKVVYCKNANRKGTYPCMQFTFLGFTFRPRRAKTKTGKRFIGFLPGVSEEALKGMRERIRGWRLNRQAFATLESLAQKYGPTIQGWWSYYGRFYGSALGELFNYLNLRLAKWAQRKYKKLRQHKRRSIEWIAGIAKKQPRLFFHWSLRLR